MSFRLKDALAGFGWALAVVAFVGGNITGDAVHPVDEVSDFVVSSPAAWHCPAGMVETQGTDPDVQLAFTACENERYIVKKLEGSDPVGFDKTSGKYVGVEEIR